MNYIVLAYRELAQVVKVHKELVQRVLVYK